MKAIIRIPTKKNRGGGEPSGSTYKRLHYCFTLVKKGAERIVADRVYWVVGDLGGFGYPTRDPRLMAEALECGHEHLPGRRTRHLVLSVQKGLSKSQRAAAFKALRASAPFLARALGATRWFAIAHDDKDHPHIHLFIANFDEAKGRRLDIRPEALSLLQDMYWTPYFDSGKRSDLEHGPRGKTIAAGKTRRESMRATAKAPVIKKLEDYLRANKAPKMEPDQLADWLFSRDLPESWKKGKLKSANGKPRRDPAIIIDEQGLKFSRFFDTLKRRKSLKITEGDYGY